MSASRPRLRSTMNSPDVASRLQATLDQEEVRRKRVLRNALIVAGLSLVAAVTALSLLQGNASAAVRAPRSPVENELGDAPAVPSKAPGVAPPKAAETVPSKPVESVPEPPIPAQTPPSPQGPRRYSVAIGQSGYEPSVIVASTDEPIIVTVEQGDGCAAGFLIPALGVSEDNSAGPVTIDLGIVAAGRYQFSCGMGMVTGELVVQ